VCTVPEFAVPDRRVLVTVDMESYSRRSNVLQHRAQQAFRDIMDQTTAELGLDRVDWIIQRGGDGELAVLPRGTSERTVAAGLAPVADRLLRAYNEGLAGEARVRLRMAVHQGLVHLDGANGFPSEAIVQVCRLVDSPQLKAALRRFPGANVALIVSDVIYREVIQHYRDLRPDHFAGVTAALPDKDFRAAAWIYVPGENAASAGSSDPARKPAHPQGPDASGRAQPASPGSQSFSGITTYGPAAFGNHNTIRTKGSSADRSHRSGNDD
jgi:hypothetical protein